MKALKVEEVAEERIHERLHQLPAETGQRRTEMVLIQGAMEEEEEEEVVMMMTKEEEEEEEEEEVCYHLPEVPKGNGRR